MSIVPNERQRGFNEACELMGVTVSSPDLNVDDELISAIASRCRDLRKQRGLSLQESGDRAGFTKSHMWEFEQGRSANPSIRMLLGLARAYGVSIAYLIGADTKQPPLDPDALRIAADIDRLLRKARES